MLQRDAYLFHWKQLDWNSIIDWKIFQYQVESIETNDTEPSVNEDCLSDTNWSSLDSLGYFVWPDTMARHSVTSQSVVFYRSILVMQWMYMSIQPSPNIRNSTNTPWMHNPMHWIKMSTTPKRDQGSCHNHFPVQIRITIQNSIWPTIAKSYFNNSSKKWGLTGFILWPHRLWAQVKVYMDFS